MNNKTAVAILLAMFIELPIWIYLQFWVLSQLNPDRLIWFLFWIYVPTLILTSILGKIITGEKND